MVQTPANATGNQADLNWREDGMRLMRSGRLGHRYAALRIFLVAIVTCGLVASITPRAEAEELIVVNSTGDSNTCRNRLTGPCTLRGAINLANRTTAHETILFNFPASAYNSEGYLVIRVADVPLPKIVVPVTIDATRNRPRGSEAPVFIELSGCFLKCGRTGEGTPWGLWIVANNTTVRGLAIRHFVFGVVIEGDQNRLEGNHLSVTPLGVHGDKAPQPVSVWMSGDNNTVGGTDEAARNVIAGRNGVVIEGGSTNRIENNYFGLNHEGSGALADSQSPSSPFFGVTGIVIKGYPTDRDGNEWAVGNSIASNVVGNFEVGIALRSDRCASTGPFSTAYLTRIRGNIVGTNSTGTRAMPNQVGIEIDGCPSDNIDRRNTIGGSFDTADKNRISGNREVGIRVIGPGNSIRGNIIGVPSFGNGAGIEVLGDRNEIGRAVEGGGNTISGNAGNGAGIEVLGDRNEIGRAVESGGNMISGNAGDGIAVFSSADRSVIQGNRIGHIPGATAAFGNGGNGITVGAGTSEGTADDTLIGGTSSLASNVITNNGGTGIRVESARRTRLQRNFIGVPVQVPTDSKQSTGNRQDGILVEASTDTLIGGTTAGARNVIASNGGYGIHLSTTRLTTIQGNLIGVVPAFLQGDVVSRGNGGGGILIEHSDENLVGGSVAGARNVISANFGDGVRIVVGSALNRVAGNYIGTQQTGTAPRSNAGSGVFIEDSSGNTVGGTTLEARNIISANRGYGVLARDQEARSINNRISGNYIGTSRDGDRAMANELGGVAVERAGFTLIGGSESGAGNLISGHSSAGISLLTGSTKNRVQGNRIGVSASGTPLANGLGVSILGSDNLVGGTLLSEANVIAFNQLAGVRVLSGVNNRLLGNSIHSNAGLGIDLGRAGVNSNDDGDVDGGANLLQNYPRIVRATLAADGKTGVSGTLRSTANTVFEIQIFSNVACDPSAFGEGQTYVGSVTVTTDALGRANWNTTVSGISAGKFLTTTATSAAGNTSEFSACRQVT